MRSIESSLEAASNAPLEIYSFEDLVKTIANLSFKYKDYLLFYRGQTIDFVNKVGNSSFYPSIYRTSKENLSKELISIRFKKLDQASELLIKSFEADQDLDGSIREIKNRKYIRWSILQHYEVCDTPLLDLTQSIRVACSFALQNQAVQGYFYVFGLPYITNRISINSEHDIVNVRLINICPPNALRPHFQEAYCVGTDDITYDYDSRSNLDFKHRLIAKYKIINRNNSFWGGEMSMEKYFKIQSDPFEDRCSRIRTKLEEVNNIELMFPGRWLNEYRFPSGKGGSELFEIKNYNEYHIITKRGNIHMFNLDNVIIDKENSKIEFTKVGIGDDKRKAYNSLRIVNVEKYTGIEDKGTQISYSKIS